MDYGKFNSAEELLKGYAELEKSFTQKCQQLSALQKQIQSQTNDTVPVGDAEIESDQTSAKGASHSDGTSGETDQFPSPSQGEAAQSVANDGITVPSVQSADSNEQANPDVAPQPPRVMTAGGNVSMALPTRPKTLKEASELAKKYFN